MPSDSYRVRLLVCLVVGCAYVAAAGLLGSVIGFWASPIAFFVGLPIGAAGSAWLRAGR